VDGSAAEVDRLAPITENRRRHVPSKRRGRRMRRTGWPAREAVCRPLTRRGRGWIFWPKPEPGPDTPARASSPSPTPTREGPAAAGPCQLSSMGDAVGRSAHCRNFMRLGNDGWTDVDGKVVLVTGADNGIGAEIAKLAASRGAAGVAAVGAVLTWAIWSSRGRRAASVG
jgi:hypothetical protein